MPPHLPHQASKASSLQVSGEERDGLNHYKGCDQTIQELAGERSVGKYTVNRTNLPSGWETNIKWVGHGCSNRAMKAHTPTIFS